MQRRAILNLWGFAAARLRQSGLARFPAPWPRLAGPVVAGTVLSLAGCGTPLGSFDVQPTTQTKLSDLMALVQFKKMPKQPEPTDHVQCPDISILDGTADDRAYGKGGAQTNANVRYQFSLNNVARDCKIIGDQMSLKIGAAGKILLGPVGAPGTFDAPIRVAIVRDADQEPVISKLYRLPVTVAAGQTEAPFALVTDPLNIPYTRPNAQHYYTIKVGFDATGNDKAPAARHHHRHKASASD
ncbi:hypothetical protein MHY1_01271 [Methylovirgula sp. HY1]|nr:hypothetical protein MHY1_01271 [Methylovirgula sp. HY1]